MSEDLQTIADIEPVETAAEPNQLKDKIVGHIRANGSISFSEFMQMSMYSKGDNTDPLQNGTGYYSEGRVDIGVEGDFMTSPEVSPVFGIATARAISEYWEAMGRPSDFNIVEMGAGNGTWARDILDEIAASFPDLYESASYTIVEYSPGLINKQRKKFEGKKVNWIYGSAKELPVSGVTGVFISNELPDAFPVDRIVKHDGELYELRIGVDENNDLIEEIGAVVDSEISNNFGHGSEMQEGETAVVNTAAVEWMKQVGNALESGYVITIDYGEWCDSPKKKVKDIGMRTFLQGGPEDEIEGVARSLNKVGQVDITSDIDFSSLKEAGESVGMQTVFTGTQAEFLNQHGADGLIEKRIYGLFAKQVEGLTAEERTELIYGQYLTDSFFPLGNYKVLVQKK